MKETMDTNTLAECLLTECNLIESDFFGSAAFFYLSGRFPELTIAQCADAISTIRRRIFCQRMESDSSF